MADPSEQKALPAFRGQCFAYSRNDSVKQLICMIGAL